MNYFIQHYSMGLYLLDNIYLDWMILKYPFINYLRETQNNKIKIRED